MTSLQLTSKQVDTVMELLSDVLYEGVDASLLEDQDKSNALVSLWIRSTSFAMARKTRTHPPRRYLPDRFDP